MIRLVTLGLVAFLALAPIGALAQDTNTITAPPADTVVVPVNESIGTPIDDATTVVDAGEADTIVVPVGNWADAILENAASMVAALLMAVFGWLLRKLPKQMVDLLLTLRVEQIMRRAVDYGINATRGAVKGKALSFDVGNEVIAAALQRVIDSAPGFLINWMGGIEAIKAMIVARLNLGEDFDATRSPILNSTGMR